MKKSFALTAVLLCLSLILASCTVEETYEPVSIPEASQGEIPEDVSKEDLTEMDFGFSDRDVSAEYYEKVTEVGAVDSDYEITSAGTYIFSGKSNGRISVNAGENDKIQIVLDNAALNGQNGPAIYIGQADKVFITLKNGTENVISDASGHSASDEGGELDGAVFSRADLTINGSGKLTVNGNFKHGIVSKDDLVIVGASINVTAKNVALNGKDCVKIKNASLSLDSGSDGIRSDNGEDASRGFVYIESGSIDIKSANDGIQAETAVKIRSAEMNIVSGGGSNGKIGSTSGSYKGIKAASDILILGGSFNIDSLDDAIHSNNTICIEGGSFSLSSKDDGIHADVDLAISAGEINIKKSYEGLESSRIFITGGKFDITASDDGLNAAGGNDSSSDNGPFGGFGGFGGRMLDNGVGEIVIAGGYMLVDASGDGIDSNGTFALTGGTVLVSGPTNNGNGAFDYGKGASVTGGTLIALGSSGMAQGFSEAQNQGAILAGISQSSGGTNIAVCDADGKTVASFTPKKAYSSIVITAPGIQLDQKYSIYSGATVEGADENGYAVGASISGGDLVSEITLDTLLYGGSGMGGGRPGGPGGGDHGGGPGGKPPRG